jgi:hypothetical protein
MLNRRISMSLRPDKGLYSKTISQNKEREREREREREFNIEDKDWHHDLFLPLGPAS